MVDEQNQLERDQEAMADTPDVSQETNPAMSSDEVSTEADVADSLTNGETSPEPTLEPEQPVVENSTVATSVDEAVEQTTEMPEAFTQQAELEALHREIAALKSQLEDRTGQYMRIAADFDNFRKRTQKEKEDLEQQVKCTTVVELLPVVDNFERARSQIKPQTESEMNIHKSYQGVYKDFVDRLKRIGVSPMRSEGKEFDPNLHEAVMRETTTEHADGTVIEELVRGYVLGERVLRHAMVKVAVAPDPSETTGSEDNQGDENN